MKRHPLRVLRRLLVFCFLILLCLADFVFCIWLRGKADSARARADWLQRWSRRHLRNINAQIKRNGKPPSRGLLVSNHLSYLDILVLAEAQPMVFLSKAEVRDWPLIGWLTRCAGTLYIQRAKKSDVARVNAQFATVVEQGLVLAIFPEGTSTGGNTLLPFRSSVLAPAVEQRWAITPTWIGYSLEDGLVEEEICYWRDMTFGLHALNLLSKRRVTVQVAYAASIEPGSDRKQLARQLHAQVCSLAERHGGKKLSNSPVTL